MNVDDDAILDATLRDFLRDRASDTAGIRDASTMASAISTHLDGVRSHRPTLRTRFQTMSTFLKIAAVAVLALAIGIAVVQLRRATDKVGSDVSPSPSPTPLVWTPASAQQDWPAPVRAEPVGDPLVVPLADGYTDPSGDIGSTDMPWIDIQRVYNGGSVKVIVAASPPSPLAGSHEPWIVYGLVLDTDLDGVPDVRFGEDIMHGDFTGSGNPHVWRTDLHTGRTESVDDNDADGSLWLCDCGYPDVGKVRFAIRGGFPVRFYAWASVIQDGRVVATDYAPDSGWLDSTGSTRLEG